MAELKMRRISAFRLLHVSVIFLFISALLLLTLTSSQPLLSEDVYPGRVHILAYEFDFSSWTLAAIFRKMKTASLGIADVLNQEQQQRIIAWFQDVQEQRRILIGMVESFYTDPSTANPAASSAHFQQQLKLKNVEFEKAVTLTELVLQSQTTHILAEMHLGWLRTSLPAPLFTLSDLPNQVILSPRSVIQVAADYTLVPSLSIPQIEFLEKSIEASGVYSALVEPLGGIATYPAMVNTAASFEFLLETIAHEWAHHFLTATPLGLRYFQDSQLRTMNETVASIAGKEISRLVIARYYPHLLPQEERNPRMQFAALVESDTRPFDFRREMHLTRVTVDMMLSSGKIEAAEKYLAERRQVFWDNGYQIRRLNQAYFAFHGSYADTPYSAAGADPVGAAVRTLRDRSRSLADFLTRVSRLSSYEELQNALSTY